MQTLKLTLDDGTAVFVEVSPSHGGTGRLSDVADSKFEAEFDKISSSLSKIVESLETQLQALTRRPDEFQIEMGAELKGQADLWIVKGETAGHFKVTMTWKRP